MLSDRGERFRTYPAQGSIRGKVCRIAEHHEKAVAIFIRMVAADYYPLSMAVEVYKPVLKPRPVQTLSQHSVHKPKQAASVTLKVPSRDIREAYKPIQPRLDLVLGVEAMTHPDEPSFAELEAVILAERLQEARRYPLP